MSELLLSRASGQASLLVGFLPVSISSIATNQHRSRPPNSDYQFEHKSNSVLFEKNVLSALDKPLTF
jgi:hypothetical protein